MDEIINSIGVWHIVAYVLIGLLVGLVFLRLTIIREAGPPDGYDEYCGVGAIWLLVAAFWPAVLAAAVVLAAFMLAALLPGIFLGWFFGDSK